MPEDDVQTIAETIRDRALKDTLVFGVGIHHAGLDTHDRNTVEELFVSGKIQILVCTSTLAWGVNFPAHLVIVKGTEYFDGKLGRYVDFPVTDVLQMMGRAGRPQFDDTGVACIFVHEPKKNFYRKFLHEPFPVESSLNKFIHNHINAEIASGRIRDMLDSVDYLSWTYFFRRLVRNPSYYGLSSAEPDAVNEHLVQLITSTIGDLEKAGCVIIEKDKHNFHATVLGSIAAFYYLDYRTVGLVRRRLDGFDVANGQGTIEDLTLLLSEAYEFSELPVRHNEEHLNAQLALTLPWNTDTLDMESSHTKTFLLLQAHFYQVSLPISDYVTDTKSVIDQAPRVVNAMIDIAADAGHLELTLRLMRLSQMIVQGLSEESSQLLQLPHMSEAACDVFESRGRVKGVKDLFRLADNKLHKILSNIFEVRSHSNDFLRALRNLPQLSVTISARINDDERNIEQDGDSFPVSIGQKVTVGVTVSRVAGGTGSEKVYSPRYHKPKSISWWLVLGSSDGELIALKRIGKISNTKYNLEFEVLSSICSDGYIVFLIPDCLYGIEVLSRFSLTMT